MKKIPLGLVLTGGFLGAIIITVGIILLSSYMTTKDVLVKHASQLMHNVATTAIKDSEDFLSPAQTAASLAQRLAYHRVVSSQNVDVMERYFFEQLRLYPQFAGIYYGDEAGNFIYVNRDTTYSPNGFRTKNIDTSSGERNVILKWRNADFTGIEQKTTPQDTYDPRKRPWYTGAVKESSLVWTDPYIFYSSGQPGMTTASPVYSNDGKIKGVIGVDIEMAKISQFLGDLSLTPNAVALIVNKGNEVIAFPDLQRIMVKGSKDKLRFAKIDEMQLPIGKAAFSSMSKPVTTIDLGKEVYTQFRVGDNNYLAVFARFNNPKWPWTIVVYAPEDDFLREIKDNQQFNLYLSLLIAASACAIGYILTKSVVRPIRQLRKDANAIKSGKLVIRTPIDTVYSEIDETVEAFRNMEKGLIKEYNANATLNDSLRKTSVETMRQMAVVAEFKDSSTANHIERMSHVSAMLAEELGFSFDGKEITSEQFRSAAAMHDIGKVGVPDHILQKPGKLTGDEWVEMLRHPKHGAEILSGTGSETIELAREISLTHHEKWDGTGYPYQLKGAEIPLCGQICAIADVFDALISRRCYKAPMPPETALQIIKDSSGTHFAPNLVEAFITRYDDVLKIIRLYPPEE